ncbi:protein of unknown function [Sulfobacillus thermosulfidooxidans DSM 9293]|uniref:DUF1874 domain-containing protein n=1 Tax=Sulfobacillus thermosulfidooxidans (strain DSM 9293 / VKM B-1269 / AT-1) TaxID=929705 RepID=A0A1W1WNP6_SULTA|nr:DUF1874 domain-containing protein [Sulfobacillus thermosulfidooxidans]SMC07944.1 protein of unknown function [Sulfobacillus thermosulfidooxidans DSM 9293]
MTYLLNAFSLNMLAHFPVSLHIDAIPLETARELLTRPVIESAVGHAETAAIFSQLLGIPVPVQRRTVTLQSGDLAIIGQYRGPRLPEGATTLPADATIAWYRVTIL